MRQWIGSALVQIMPSHYLNQCWVIVNWTVRNKLVKQWNLNRNFIIFIKENALENVVCYCGVGCGGVWGVGVVLYRFFSTKRLGDSIIHIFNGCIYHLSWLFKIANEIRSGAWREVLRQWGCNYLIWISLIIKKCTQHMHQLACRERYVFNQPWSLVSCKLCRWQ